MLIFSYAKETSSKQERIHNRNRIKHCIFDNVLQHNGAETGHKYSERREKK